MANSPMCFPCFFFSFCSLQSVKKEKINEKLAEIFVKIGSKENTREVNLYW